MEATIYARISRDPEEQRLGVDRQERRGREIAEANGWTVADVLVDNDATGTNGDRAGFIELQRRIEAGDIDVIILQDQDRIARNLRVLLPFADLCATHDVRIESWGGPLDLVTADGELVASVRGATDAHYSRKLSEKSRAAHKDLATRGKPNGGIRPFGFTDDRVTHDPVEADLIREAAKSVVAGVSLRSITQGWNAEGVTTPTGKPWVSVVLRRLLLSPRVRGQREIGRWVKDPATGKRKREILGVSDAVWDAILDPELAAAVETALRAHRAPTSTTTLRYWLRGVATCGKCGRRLGTAQHAKGRRIYRCEPTPMGCGGIGASAPGAEAAVEAALLEYLAGDRLTVDATELSDATLAERLAALTERERNLGQAIARGTITVAIGEEASTEIVAEREALEARIATNTTAAERVAALEGLPHDLGALWGEMTPREKNRVLRIVVDEVTINPSTVGGPKFDPGRVEVAWQTP